MADKSEDYTPTTGMILELVVSAAMSLPDARTQDEAEAVFYRWLAAHNAEVRKDEREKCAEIAKRYGNRPGGTTMEKLIAEDIAARVARGATS